MEKSQLYWAHLEWKKLSTISLWRNVREHLIEARVFNNLISSLCEDLSEVLLQSGDDFTQKQFAVLVNELVADLSQVRVAFKTRKNDIFISFLNLLQPMLTIEEIFQIEPVLPDLYLQLIRFERKHNENLKMFLRNSQFIYSRWIFQIWYRFENFWRIFWKPFSL